jgi:hypothetical protein
MNLRTKLNPARAGTGVVVKPQDSNSTDVLSCEQLSYCNTLVLESIVEILSEKGLLDWKEVHEHVQRFKQQLMRRSPASKGFQ